MTRSNTTFDTVGKSVLPELNGRPGEATLLTPFEDLAAQSSNLIRPKQTGVMSRYLYLGERGGGDMIRLGIFAGIHGDEPEGALAMGRFLRILEQDPQIARGYALFLYPLCNPTGHAAGTRESRSGRDLNREFWRQSPEPEVRFLESEICLHAFDGIITLHSDNTSNGLYGFVNGAVLSENLLVPALRAGERFLARDRRQVIDGFPANNGIIYRSYDGVLRAVPGLDRPPFELTLETPQKAPLSLQIESVAAALQTILVEYRSLISIGQNI